ncbi:hypothetical protein PVAND_001930 [Polypedilum vanderplanki]|uniref:Uncharacterized protein n=1 Tax=Polypedilum vanderplanki TaxID=319348 RepID=A0A9J6BPU8_POLVA|nr:hypothetical protein PVAND_001930 [Polypedilum vanderplanki]
MILFILLLSVIIKICLGQVNGGSLLFAPINGQTQIASIPASASNPSNGGLKFAQLQASSVSSVGSFQPQSSSPPLIQQQPILTQAFPVQALPASPLPSSLPPANTAVNSNNNNYNSGGGLASLAL